VTPLNLDAGDNADWTKRTWDLPRTRDEMMSLLPNRQSLERFLELPVARMNPAIVDELGMRSWYLPPPVEQADRVDSCDGVG
jgi:hypothetical protein